MNVVIRTRLLCGGALALAAVAALAGRGHASPPSAPAAMGLRCEYLVNPLGIDVREPRLSWLLPPGPRGRRQRAYQLLVAGSQEALGRERGDLWDSGRVDSEQSRWVGYRGKPLASGRRCYWKVRVWDESGRPGSWSAPGHWSMGLLEAKDWDGLWIGLPKPAGVAQGTPLPFPWLRKTFVLDEKPEHAAAYVNALGYYELYVNGTKVDDHLLSPTVSDYSKRNLYVTHDVTRYLVKGKNCVALWLGRGWYVRGHAGVIHDGPLVRAQVDMTMPGDSSQRLSTDRTWKVRESPLRPLGRGLAFGDYGGEQYDARKELPGWNTAELNESGWELAGQFRPPAAVTAAQMVEPNRIMETIQPAGVKESGAGAYVFDMGRSFTGWFELKLPRGTPPGRTIKLEYSDFPVSEPRWQTHNQRDEYITGSGEEQVFRSRFNYHGFGYVRVTGLDRMPSVEDGRGYLIHTAYQPAGSFECSDELLNRIYRMTTWTYRSLSLGGYVVDCPTRERLGYGGDAGTSHELGLLNFDTGALYTRWLSDWRAAQDPKTGDLPYTAPHYQDRGGGGPMWSGFVVTLPWQVYLHYGDRGVLDTNYPMIEKWLAFLETKCESGILAWYQSFAMNLPQWNFLGDWVAPHPAGGGQSQFGDPQSALFINNCHFVYQLRLASKIAGVLGRREDADRYHQRANVLAAVLHKRFYNPAKQSYVTGEQPYLAFPLLIGVVPPELRPAILKRLEETIRVADRGHVNAGMHGVYFLLRLLTEYDRGEPVYEMVRQRDYPGWGYMVEQGASTAWENWRGTGSRIHDTLISVGAWFTQGIGGIRHDQTSPGFKHFLIRPSLVGNLSFARSRYESPYGTIVSNWRREGGRLQMWVNVPPGTTATVAVPTSAPDAVLENSRPALRQRGIWSAGREEGRALFGVSSGQYWFSAPLRTETTVQAPETVSPGKIVAGPVIPVWPGAAPGSEDWTQKEVEFRDSAQRLMVRNVVRPTLTPFLPESGKATGSAVIVCPGGGFRFHSWENEGLAVARWLRDRGVAAFVLKYRLRDTGATEEEFQKSLIPLRAGRPPAGTPPPPPDPEQQRIVALAVADGRQALKVVRERAAEWGLVPDRIGILGFSAGAAVTMGAVLQSDSGTRPAFAAPIYGGGTGGAPVPSDAPPLFILAASDDPGPAAGSTRLYSEWQAVGREAELHLYAKGGHGFGMRKQNLPIDGWIDRFGEWLAAQGLLKPAR